MQTPLWKACKGLNRNMAVIKSFYEAKHQNLSWTLSTKSTGSIKCFLWRPTNSSCNLKRHLVSVKAFTECLCEILFASQAGTCINSQSLYWTGSYGFANICRANGSVHSNFTHLPAAHQIPTTGPPTCLLANDSEKWIKGELLAGSLSANSVISEFKGIMSLFSSYWYCSGFFSRGTSMEPSKYYSTVTELVRRNWYVLLVRQPILLYTSSAGSELKKKRFTPQGMSGDSWEQRKKRRKLPQQSSHLLSKLTGSNPPYTKPGRWCDSCKHQDRKGLKEPMQL